MGAFGEKLRKQRELRGIELDAISNTTKISTRMLRALEDEHFDQLPGGVFNKGFVRAYARHVGLDEEEAVTDYLTALRESQIQAQQILPNFRAPAVQSDDWPATQPSSTKLPAARLGAEKTGAETGERKTGAERPATYKTPARVLEDISRDEFPREANVSSRSAPAFNSPAERWPKKYPAGILAEAAADSSAPIPWEKLAAVLLVIALALAVLSYRRHRHLAAALQPAGALGQSASTNSSLPLSAPTSSATPDQPIPAQEGRTSPESEATAPPPPGDSVASPNASRSSSAENPTAAAANSTAAGSPRPSPATSSPQPSATLSASSPPTSKIDSSTGPTEEDVNPPVVIAKNTAHTSATKSPLSFTLLIRASETSWVSIVADGKVVAEETLIAPAGTSVRATHQIVVRAGNAAGIGFLLNGKEIPKQGNEGEVRTYTFDATGLRETSPAQ